MALRCHLGVGNAMGLDFEEQALYHYQSPITGASPACGHHLFICFSACKVFIDADIIAALLQASLGGSTAAFYVHAFGETTFCFSVASAAIAQALLLEKPIHHRNFTFHFASENKEQPADWPSSRQSLPQLLRSSPDLATHFEIKAWLRFRSFTTPELPTSPHGCRMSAQIIQFLFTLHAQLVDSILACIFGKRPELFNTTFEDLARFSFTVACPEIAELIISLGNFQRLGILLRFLPSPRFNQGSSRSPSSPTMSTH